MAPTSESSIRSWWKLATSRAVVKRAMTYAVVVGAILITINHSDAILSGDVGAGPLLRMALTVMVPYIVSTLSSVGAMRSARRQTPPPDNGM